jgi:transposase-like protein/IS1 family transposase
MNLAEIVNEIQQLDEMTQQRLLAYLQSSIGNVIYGKEPITKEIKERKNEKGFVCPHCQSTQVVRFGKYTIKSSVKVIEKQRYKCKSCTKTFTDLSNTPLNRTRKMDKWLKFIECMIEGHSLRKSAMIIGRISWVTLFYWRHKILSALSQISLDKFNGIVEMDETYFLYSEKGKRGIVGREPRKRGGESEYRGISKDQVCVLVARDRHKGTISSVLWKGRVIKAKLEKKIGEKLSKENILCTDSWRAFSTYAKEKGVEHYRFKSDGKVRVIKGIYHIQNVNNYHSRLKKWIQRFNGVATKYLENYLSWFRYLDMNKYEKTSANIKEMMVNSCLFPVTATFNSLRLSELKI